ncbi:fatty acid desaturase [Oligoflexaceae bacterium]|nr:fatty acid desaturase [Oligoflexaceae bacterium]
MTDFKKHQNFERCPAPTEHINRTKLIARRFPDVLCLQGVNAWSSALIGFLCLVQLGIGLALNQSSVLLILLVSYLVGTSISLAIMVLVHDASHSLVARSKTGNNLAMLIANIGIVWPAAFFYKYYHLKHHRFIGQYGLDVDMPTKWESRFAGTKWWSKLVWLIFFPAFYVIPRMIAEKSFKWQPMMVISIAVQVFVIDRMRRWGLDHCLLYMAISPLLMMSICPAMGSRGILEHLVYKKGQETYSYYGPYNRLTLNNGYHTEHHDFSNIPWNRLPKLHQIAKEFYIDRYIIPSYFHALKTFVLDPKVSLWNRIERNFEHSEENKNSRCNEDNFKAG